MKWSMCPPKLGAIKSPLEYIDVSLVQLRLFSLLPYDMPFSQMQSISMMSGIHSKGFVAH